MMIFDDVGVVGQAGGADLLDLLLVLTKGRPRNKQNMC